VAVSHKDDDSEVETQCIMTLPLSLSLEALEVCISTTNDKCHRNLVDQKEPSILYRTALIWSRAVLVPLAIVLSRCATWGERRKHGSCSESLFL